MKKILIIDDDADINNLLNEILTKNGYSVLRAWSGTEALLILEKQRPDLVILDLMLPGLSGEDVLPKLGGIPVIVLSAKNSVSDKVALLSAGASDYMTKPFAIDELLARVAVRLRDSAEKKSCAYTCHELTLDTDSHSVTVNGEPVVLTKTEYAILKAFMAKPGKVLSKSCILDTICFDTPDCTEDSLKVHVSNLRRKIREAGGNDYIESVWGIGFIFN